MTKDDIIHMAREAGDVLSANWLERFAALAAKAERDRIATEAQSIIKRAEQRGAEIEREACASLARDLYAKASADEIEMAIRARTTP